MFTIFACIKYICTELISRNHQSENNYTMNPYDLFMLEQLIKFKNNFPCRIVGITMGPIACTEVIRRVIAMGLDDAFIVSDPCFSGSDTYATSYILGKVLNHIGQADIYAFGEKAIDGETGQVPIGVASRLNLHCITGVQEFSVAEKDKIVLRRQFAENREIMEAFLPCAICFKGFTTTEPQVSLLKLKQARKYSPIVINAESLNLEKQYCGQNGSKTIVKNIVNTIDKRNIEFLEGTLQFKADKFKKLISKNGRNNY